MGDNPLISLLGVLVGTFSIILMGYVGLWSKFFSPTTRDGMGHLCAKLALPAALFRGVATIELGQRGE